MRTRGKDLKPRQPRRDQHSPYDSVECRDCGLHFLRITLSKAGLCLQCSGKRVETACRQLRMKRGAIYEKWLAMTAAGVARSQVGLITNERR